ncbi:MAG TPA: carbonate dehydratase [Eubacteriaceae bacterium]|nr:carbonate dehydratase [Eubacteriaceae bacterium]
MSNAPNKENLKQTKFYRTSLEDTYAKLGSSEEGLSKEEAQNRLDAFGENKLPEEKGDSALKRFLAQFNNALIYVLLGASVLTFFMGHYVDTAVILGVVIINAIVGFIQEGKAQKALENIKKMLSLQATVIRSGNKTQVDATQLVPGDVITLSAGDKIPADVRLIETSNFQTEEASLTGEAEAVYKFTKTIEKEAVLGERFNMAYTGTSVVSGTAKGIVTATASNTELGKINRMLSETEAITTPLIRKINDFGTKLSFVILIFIGLVFLYGYFITGFGLAEIALAMIGLAVSAIPEGLPAILTITLAIGVQKMAGRHAIIRQLPSVETLGSVTVICSDKTGTLTKSEMTVKKIFTKDYRYDVEGTGYNPEGDILYEESPVDPKDDQSLKLFLQAAAVCNDAKIERTEDGSYKVNGSPTEGAMRAVAMKGGEDIDPERIASIPFDSEYKYMATLNDTGDKRMIYFKGAPDQLIKLCQYQLSEQKTEKIDPGYWESKIEEGAKEGYRMLACAYAEADPSKDSLDHDDLNGGLIFLGLAGIIDPPRPEVIDAIKECKTAGIKVKMITGDHVLTATSIGEQLGIGDGKTVLSGAELEKMSDDEMQKAVKDCDVFARTSPEHKLRLVTALQANREVCAMTGDGVNDAPALKKADIGVAMGIKGTEVTKEAASMVLADDNFSSIVSAVEEGRTIYDNLRKTLLFILPTNGAEAVVIVSAILFGMTLPVSPVQILWINMVTTITLAIALAFEPMEENTMEMPPRDPSTPMIGRYFLFRIVLVSAVIGGFTLYAFNVFQNGNGSTELAQTVAVNTIVIGELFYLFNCRKMRESSLTHGFLKNKVVFISTIALVALQLAFNYLPFMNSWFGSETTSLAQWTIPLLCGIGVFVIVEIEKVISEKIRKRNA